MKEYLLLGVDTSIAFTKSEYLFSSKTKNVLCKYIPQHAANKSDTLIATYREHKLSAEEIYNAVTEILSSLAFTRNCQMVFHPGYSLRGKDDISLMNNRYSYIARTTPVTEKMGDFIYIPPVINSDQASLVRLYRQANSNNNVYFQILFFWHTLVYPRSSDNAAVSYVDKLSENLPEEISYCRDEINRVKGNYRIFAKDFSTLGKYIKEGARHSVAHITRHEKFGHGNFILDELKQERHLWDIATILKIFSRHRLENEYQIKGPHDINYFEYFNPADEQN